MKQKLTYLSPEIGMVEWNDDVILCASTDVFGVEQLQYDEEFSW